jgi:hypothetical protein
LVISLTPLTSMHIHTNKHQHLKAMLRIDEFARSLKYLHEKLGANACGTNKISHHTRPTQQVIIALHNFSQGQ